MRLISGLADMSIVLCDEPAFGLWSVLPLGPLPAIRVIASVGLQRFGPLSQAAFHRLL